MMSARTLTRRILKKADPAEDNLNDAGNPTSIKTITMTLEMMDMLVPLLKGSWR